MNKNRRKTIASLVAEVQEHRAALEALQEQVQEVLDEEQEYLDNMPESLQSGEKGEVASAAIDALSNALSDIETSVDSLNDVETNLEEAQG